MNRLAAAPLLVSALFATTVLLASPSVAARRRYHAAPRLAWYSSSASILGTRVCASSSVPAANERSIVDSAPSASVMTATRPAQSLRS